jgi:Ser-tRNA(Ala) deacylase AlaX
VAGERTERLWETEPGRNTALAEVVETRGEEFRLDRSLFRPKSRAYRHPQRADGGTVWVQGGDKQQLVTAFERNDQLWHRVDGPTPAVGDELQLHLDQDQRELDSRGHTAMHLLLRAITQLVDVTLVDDPEVKGGGRFRLDLRGWSIQPGVLAEAVERANTWIEQDVPVEHGYTPRDVAEHKLDPQPFEKGESYPGPSTTIETVGVDGVCAYPCDGTHADRTGDLEDLVLREADPRQEGVWMVVGEVPKPGRY